MDGDYCEANDSASGGCELMSGPQRATFASWAFDASMAERVEQAVRVMITSNEPAYRKVGKASRCLVHLGRHSFPLELDGEAEILLSVFKHVVHAGDGEYPIYSGIPRGLQQSWSQTLLRVYALLMTAKGRYCAVECRDVCNPVAPRGRCIIRPSGPA